VRRLGRVLFRDHADVLDHGSRERDRPVKLPGSRDFVDHGGSVEVGSGWAALAEALGPDSGGGSMSYPGGMVRL
jgi:hypothetical protein